MPDPGAVSQGYTVGGLFSTSPGLIVFSTVFSFSVLTVQSSVCVSLHFSAMSPFIMNLRNNKVKYVYVTLNLCVNEDMFVYLMLLHHSITVPLMEIIFFYNKTKFPSHC